MKLTLELKPEYRKQGYTAKASINPDYILMIKREKKKLGNLISAAIKSGDAKKAVELMQWASGYNQDIRTAAANHDKNIFDSTGRMVAFWVHDEHKTFAVEI